MAVIPLTISGIKEAQAQLEDLGKEFDKFKKDPIKSKKLAKEFNDLSKDIDKATESFDEMNKSGQHLSATFEQIYGEDLKPMTGRIGELEDRLYELSLAGAENTQEFKDMSAEVVKLKTTIRETDKQIDLMTENRGLAVFGEGFTQIGSSLLRLDFVTAGKDAEALNNAVGNLGKLGSQALKGLGKTVGQLSKAFIKMGAALFVNPIFLIGVVIVGVVAAITKLLDSLGFLQPILDGVAYAFGVIKDAINAVVQSLKDFLDWIGLTSFAVQDAAAKEQEAYERAAAAAENKQKRVTKAYDQEIRLANIAGEDTTKLELRKQYAIINTAKARRDALAGQIEANKKSKKLSEEEVQTLKDQLKETKQLIGDSVFEVKAIKAQQKADNDKANDEERATNKANYEKMLADRIQFEKDRLDAQRRIKDLELDLLDEGIEKDLEKSAEEYKRKLEDLEANEKLTSEEKIKLKELILQQEFEAEKEIRLKYEEDLDKALRDAEKIREEERDKEEKERREAQLAAQEAFNKATEEQTAKRLKIEEDYNDAKENLDEVLLSSFQGMVAGLEAAGVQSAGLQKTLALVEIAANTAKSLSSVIAGATAAAAATGPAAPYVLGGYIAAGIATVIGAIGQAYAALRTAPAIGGGATGGNPSASVSSASAAAPAQPSFELFGQNNNANNLTSAPDNEQGQEITVKAVVSETEVTETQNKIKKITESASL